MNISKEHVQYKNTEKFSDHHEEHQDVPTFMTTYNTHPNSCKINANKHAYREYRYTIFLPLFSHKICQSE